MAADADKVNARILEVSDALAEPLGCVHMKKGVMLGERVRNLADGLDDAGLVVYEHDRNEQGVRAECPRQLLGGNGTAGVWLQERDFKAVPRQELKRLKDGLMLDGCRDDVALAQAFAALAQAEDRDIVALGGAAGEYHSLALCFNDGGNLVARFLNGL